MASSLLASRSPVRRLRSISGQQPSLVPASWRRPEPHLRANRTRCRRLAWAQLVADRGHVRGMGSRASCFRRAAASAMAASVAFSASVGRNTSHGTRGHPGLRPQPSRERWRRLASSSVSMKATAIRSSAPFAFSLALMGLVSRVTFVRRPRTGVPRDSAVGWRVMATSRNSRAPALRCRLCMMCSKLLVPAWRSIADERGLFRLTSNRRKMQTPSRRHLLALRHLAERARLSNTRRGFGGHIRY